MKSIYRHRMFFSIVFILSLITSRYLSAEEGFEENFSNPGPGGVAEKWQVGGGFIRASCENGIQRFSLKGNARLTLKRTVNLPPQKIMLVQVTVRSKNAIVLAAGKRRMSYSTPGKKQLMIDLIDTGLTGKVTLKFTLGGLPEKAEFEISGLSIRTPILPARLMRQTTPSTELTNGNKPKAIIIYPHGDPMYLELAKKIQDTISSKSGVALPLLSDVEATEKDVPKLKPECVGSNLIIIGRLGINRALWPAYNRFLAAVDGYYPGGDGYTLRTAVNVMRNGRNHIILGGSNEKGAAKAVREFIKLLTPTKLEKGNSLVLPFLLKVNLGGECLTRFKKNNELWMKNPLAAGPHKLEPGYGKVVRWYVNAMGYYWSGMDGYKKRSRIYLKDILDDSSYTHQYIVEFMVRAWKMVGDTRIYTVDECEKMDALITQNFIQFLTGPDLGWMTLFNRPYINVIVRNRHSIAPWMADVQMGEFLQGYFKLNGDLAKIVDYRLSEKKSFLDWWVLHSFNLGLPRTLGGSDPHEIIASMFRYSLENEKYAFFTKGNAKKALRLWDMAPTRSLSFDDRLLTGMIASYYADGRYLTLFNSLSEPLQLFQDRYLCGVHRYRSGSELKPEPADTLAGVKTTQMQEQDHLRWSRIKFVSRREPDFPSSEGAEFTSFRDGFGKNDDFMMLSGLGTSAGVITDFSSHGKTLFMESSHATFGRNSESYYDRNAVSVTKNDRWVTDPKPFAAAARRNWIADFGKSGGVSISLNPHMGTEWRREIIWLKSGLYLVKDVVTALDAGRFTIQIGWRPQGLRDWTGKSLVGGNGNVLFKITPFGKGFKPVENIADYLKGEVEHPKFHFTSTCDLKKGEKAIAYALLEVKKSGKKFHNVELSKNKQSVVLKSPGDNRIVVFGPRETESLKSDASVLIIDKSGVGVINGSKVNFQGCEILNAGSKTSKYVEINQNIVKSPIFSDSTPLKAMGKAEESCTEIKNNVKAYETLWRYTGAQFFKKLKGRGENGIVDFGKNVNIAEVRAIYCDRFGTSTPLPQDLKYAVDDGSGKPPPSQSAKWLNFKTERIWRMGVQTGNYGKSIPGKKDFQIMYPKVDARYVKGGELHKFAFYAADAKESRTRLRLRILKMTPTSKPVLFLASAPWPKFCGRGKENDYIVAVIDLDGNEVFRHQTETNLQSVKILDQRGNGHKQIFVATVDAKIRVFNPDGKLAELVDFYKMHQRFNEEKGRKNTRHPAGGYTMPYDIGLWRSGPNGKSKMVVSRYHSFSFLDRDLRFEGVLMRGDYVNSTLLPHGVDFNDDGLDEMYSLGLFALSKLYGKLDRRVTEPNGRQFYPQVYHYKRFAQPKTSNKVGVDGERVLLFETVPVANAKPVIAVCRPSYFTFFDGVKQKWGFQWKPPIAITAAAITRIGKKNSALVATVDHILWELNFNSDFSKLVDFKNWTLPCSVASIAGFENREGKAVLSTDKGLLLFSDGKFEKIADGSWMNAVEHNASANDSAITITAVKADGQVRMIKRKAK